MISHTHPLRFDQNQATTSYKTPPSPHRLYDLQDIILDKLEMFFLRFDQNQAPTPYKTPPSPHRLYDLQDIILDKLEMYFLSQLSDFVPLKNGLYSFRAHID